MLQSPSITQNCTVELSPWCFCIPVSKCIFWLRNDWLLTATHLVFYSKTSLLEKCGVHFLFPHLLKTPPRLTHTSALTLQIDFSLLPSSCKLPETWRRVFAAILGHTENQHQVKDGDCTRDNQWQPSNSSSRPIRVEDWLHPARVLWASGNVEGDTRDWSWQSRPFFGQIWRVENIPLSNMRTCFCPHPSGTKSLKCSNFNYGHNMSSRDTKE